MMPGGRGGRAAVAAAVEDNRCRPRQDRRSDLSNKVEDQLRHRPGAWSAAGQQDSRTERLNSARSTADKRNTRRSELHTQLFREGTLHGETRNSRPPHTCGR